MSNDYTPYEGDIGTIVDIDMQEDLSMASGLKFLVRKPDDSEVEWAATLSGTQHLRYETQVGDLIAGDYAINPKATIGSWTGLGDTIKFRVRKKYN